jgi:broad specificity phosphatase PhoE
MKFLFSAAFVVTIFLLVELSTPAQSRKTILLVRHAEKDVSATADPNDPALTPGGAERVAHLGKKLRKYKVGAVYSTNYQRTLNTARPTAERRRLAVQTYDAKKPDELLDQIMKSKTKRFLIVGHSNTIPDLANKIVKKEVFADLSDEEYGVVYLIKLKNGKVVKTQIITY